MVLVLSLQVCVDVQYHLEMVTKQQPWEFFSRGFVLNVHRSGKQVQDNRKRLQQGKDQYMARDRQQQASGTFRSLVETVQELKVPPDFG